MAKRLLALLVFIPMFLIAWYVRSSRQSQRAAPEPQSSGSRQSSEAQGDQTPPAAPHNRKSRGARNQSGDFDFYLLTLSWSPEFCATHPGKPECAAHPGFVLHGLWPQNNDGTYPEHCSTAPGPSDPASFRDIFPDQSLLDHEWSTHGTCSGLAPSTYLDLARRAVHLVQVPSMLTTLRQTTSEPPETILADFAQINPSIPQASLALSCGSNYLTAVEVCLDKSLHAVSCSNVRSCRANTVRIVPPGK